VKWNIAGDSGGVLGVPVGDGGERTFDKKSARRSTVNHVS
jgi:hypothetical protein